MTAESVFPFSSLNLSLPLLPFVIPNLLHPSSSSHPFFALLRFSSTELPAKTFNNPLFKSLRYPNPNPNPSPLSLSAFPASGFLPSLVFINTHFFLFLFWVLECVLMGFGFPSLGLFQVWHYNGLDVF
ncbi:unnamed protein product [Citrullus colocynthis]|uniref:Uncharacterized protein n=1 Tax=Citrullus colocynthis TaxID=252529 RepID=A0ABP0Z9J4_9ROSI